jgi:hypothetical protein
MVHYKIVIENTQVYNVIFSLLETLSLPMATGLALLSPPSSQASIPVICQSCAAPSNHLMGLVFYYLNVPNVRMMLIQDRQKRSHYSRSAASW